MMVKTLPYGIKEHEYIQNRDQKIYGIATQGCPLDSIEYQKGIGTILPYFSFKLVRILLL